MSQHIVQKSEFQDKDILIQSLHERGCQTKIAKDEKVRIRTYSNEEIECDIACYKEKNPKFLYFGDAGFSFNKSDKKFDINIDHLDQRSFEIEKLKQIYVKNLIKKNTKKELPLSNINIIEKENKIQMEISL